jgi:hypothetical protein
MTSTNNTPISSPLLLIDVISVDCSNYDDDDDDDCCDYNKLLSSFPSSSSSYDLLINRVSDASPPITIKKTLSILTLFELHSIPIINGSKCFTIGCNKWLHHEIFQKAQCYIPRSIVVSRNDDNNNNNTNLERYCTAIVQATNCLLDSTSTGCTTWPILWKPNSGSFGVGITLLTNMEDVIRRIHDEWDTTTATTTTSANHHRDGASTTTTTTTTTTTITDGTVILQEYLKPRLDTTYRIWFIGDRVCGAVSVTQGQQCQTPTTTFTNACVGSTTTCTLQNDNTNSDRPIFTTWDPPEDVCDKVLHIAQIANADCGSVELLYTTESDGMEYGVGPYYFDLNMVSTFPNVNNMEVHDPDNLWRQCGNNDDDDDGDNKDDYKKDFYKELAEYILTKLPSAQT